MKNLRWLMAVAAVLGLGAMVLLLNSCSSGEATVDLALVIPGAHEVGNKACLDCHAGIVRRFPSSPHARVHRASLGPEGDTGCESCHGPGSKHIAAGGGAKFILNPGKDARACLQCHLQVQSEFQSPHHHPLMEGRMNCVQCHDPHGSDIFKPAGGRAMSRLNESCAACHQAQARPFVFEHAALREGCVICHNPHGSVNRKMLTQSDPNLCLRCHAQTPGPASARGQTIYIGNYDHTGFLKMGSCWTAGCHTAVHGSNVDVRLRY